MSQTATVDSITKEEAPHSVDKVEIIKDTRPGIVSEKAGADTIRAMLTECLDMQKSAYQKSPVPEYEQRVEDLNNLERLVRENQEEIIQAINADFGNRSRHETLLAEIMGVLDSIKHARKSLKKWMKPIRRSVDMTLFPGGKNRLIAQPKGVVGIVVPWNFPLYLTFGPLIPVLAAGNRAMIKMSTNSRQLSQLLAKLMEKYLPAEKVTLLEETGGVGRVFSTLPFDHIVFTGSGATGSSVMQAAAKNLTPVTLELGGKSPCVIAPDYDIQKAAERLLFFKLFNAGQICVTVDYLFVSDNKREQFIKAAQSIVPKRYPDINGADYTSIIDDAAYERLEQTLQDAKDKGATLINLTPGQQPNRELRKMPPHLVLDVTDDMRIMQEEIFGPLLPVKTYSSEHDVVTYINDRDRPLAFYPFTNDRQLQDFYITHTMSGGVTVNDVACHVQQHDLPFGGIGASGMGHYHGYEGFVEFSKMRPVFYQPKFSALKLLAPPYGARVSKMLDFMLKMTR
ncbi:coniferyl aldehyde dehydrogenase [Spongorhabdus nitratireducens]